MLEPTLIQKFALTFVLAWPFFMNELAMVIVLTSFVLLKTPTKLFQSNMGKLAFTSSVASVPIKKLAWYLVFCPCSG